MAGMPAADWFVGVASEDTCRRDTRHLLNRTAQFNGDNWGKELPFSTQRQSENGYEERHKNRTACSCK
ncbi:hypothetical protein DPMN_070357 [Dreissena polymorpha]|uniref:Uncharacterized protein n=1 Tax=Dreissena polymorpha TaxID=45954 RepID=A0A9D3Z5T8_DREPO|nr:hypothetical protein DPMN_070357 [Dreissena polymorpha]